MEQFEKVAARHQQAIPGDEVFKLHDTFGFPLELTRELAEERGIEVDEEGFRAAMEAQRERSRGGIAQRWVAVKDLPRSEFTGYHELATSTSAIAGPAQGREAPSRRAAEGDAVEVFLERTPFYAESGGQIGDTGIITTPSGRVRVEDTQKPADGVIAHLGTVITGEVQVGETATASVDARAPACRSRGTTRPRTCCTRRCARRSARTSCRKARGSGRTTRPSTSRSTVR